MCVCVCVFPRVFEGLQPQYFAKYFSFIYLLTFLFILFACFDWAYFPVPSSNMCTKQIRVAFPEESQLRQIGATQNKTKKFKKGNKSQYELHK